MHCFLFCSLFLICFNLFAQDSKIQSDLELLSSNSSRRIGGAGNGGLSYALNISKMINRKALSMGVKDLRSFNKKYSILVGDYSLCETGIRECNLPATYYPSYKALLVDRKSWDQLSSEDLKVVLANLVLEILNA